MSKATRLLNLLAAGLIALTACGSPHAAPAPSSGTSAKPATPVASATKPAAPTPSSNTQSTTKTTGAPDCVGLSICPPPPPDADGNPACFYSDGWQATSSGAGIEVWYFHEPQNMSTPVKVTAVVRKKDGSTETQDATIEAGQQVHRFEFPAIDKSTVAEVLFDSGSGRCFVVGPGS
ncbi:hypothetical protein [Mycobacterium paragordonae]|uniref:DUF3558 domain-containing protein n=1 Tax=Mycobacterium paragordonae TaxID=1389713 RepID=A0A4R5WUQ0_9MYCO|nr:hypothetical protein [Mycobacterium paragordonae]MDP7734122.1 hypothetical protein [Mycobacterium paragordonae]TDK97271.1 hypothetical protein EUA02_10990 [Mycobacterium paragordonae]TDK99066.1 hypothetical protein EI067_06185 [Mycobacterium paragordonae]TDL11110.1 hypothetical protein EUA05_03080 [Mycobacterium paragordonae]